MINFEICCKIIVKVVERGREKIKKYIRSRKLLLIAVLCNIFLLFSVVSRDCTNDTYCYDSGGLHFSSKDLGIDKFFPRSKVETRGIDVSKWQGDIDWGKVKRSGVGFAIIRLGFGRRLDRRFHANMRNAKLNGIPCGVYHYSYATNRSEARAEADYCLRNLQQYKLEYPVVFDVEEDRLRNLGQMQLSEICDGFCSRMREKGYYVSIYSYSYWVKNYLPKVLFSKYDLWVAKYGGKRPYGCTFGMWQYTSSGQVDGINGRTDCDISYFDYPSMMREMHLNGY